MGNSAAQDIFAFVPGDTDYRMFATDFGSVPGLDIIFLHGGYFYHTSTDTVERLLPGSIQARGDNLFSLLKAFANSSKLENAHDRGLNKGSGAKSLDVQPMFFDYLSWFLVYYSRRQGLVSHSIPVAIFLLIPFFLRFSKFGLLCSFAALFDFIKGILFHVIGVIFAVIFPIFFSILRLLFSGQSMNWFAHPYLAYMMFVPCSLAGMLIPTIYWNFFPLSQAGYLLKSSKEVVNESPEVHCPVVEMPTRSKLSCLSWNKHTKNYIATSDFEGIVTVWDVNTRQSVMEYVK